MCCIFSCCVWTLDVIQRVLTFLLACILAAMVVLMLGVAIVVGVAYGYNYSMAEFISLGKSDVTVYMRRGQFSDVEDRDSDRPPLFPESRRFDDILPHASPVDINNLLPDAAGKARLLANSWEQAKEARKYDGILSRFTPRRGKGYKKESKQTQTLTDTNFRVMEKHEPIFFDGESRDQDYFYMETTKSPSLLTKQIIKSPYTEHRLVNKLKLPTPIIFDEKKQVRDDFYFKSLKSKSVSTKRTILTPSTKRQIIENNKYPTPTYVNEKNRGQVMFNIDSIKSKTTSKKPSKKFLSSERHIVAKIKPPMFFDDDEGKDDFRIESIKTKTFTTKLTLDEKTPSMESRIMEKFKPVYIDEDIQEQNNIEKEISESQIKIVKITNKWSSTNRRMVSFKPTDFTKIDRKQYMNYNKTIKSKMVTVETPKKENKPDIKIRIQGINFNKPEKDEQSQRSFDENNDDNYSEEEDSVIKAIQEETKLLHKEKTQQTGGRIPDVKIRVGKLNFHTSQPKASYTNQILSKKPDLKIRVESKDYFDSNKYDKKALVKPLENNDYEERMKTKSWDKNFATIKKSTSNSKVQIQQKNYTEIDIKVSGKDNYKDLINKKNLDVEFDESRTPDIKIKLQSEEYNKSNRTNQKIMVEPLKKDYKDLIYRKTLKDRFQTVDETRTTDTKIQMRSKNYNELDKNNKNSVVAPIDEDEDYDEQFDRKTLGWRFRTVDRMNFDDGATRHPYKMQQPLHPYREDDDDVMYKPV